MVDQATAKYIFLKSIFFLSQPQKLYLNLKSSMLELRTGTLCLHIAERIQFHNIHGLNNTSSVCCESGLWLNFRPKCLEWDLVMLHADLGTDKSSLILFVPKGASYAREINAVQKIYRDDRCSVLPISILDISLFGYWFALLTSKLLPHIHIYLSSTWLVSTKRHTATTKCTYLTFFRFGSFKIRIRE